VLTKQAAFETRIASNSEVILPGIQFNMPGLSYYRKLAAN